MRQLDRLISFADGLARSGRAYIWTIRAIQLIVFALAGSTAFILRFDLAIPRRYKAALYCSILLWLLCKSAVFHAFGLGRAVWRYFGVPDLFKLWKANAIASLAAGLVILAASPAPLPRSIYLIDFAVCVVFTTGIRVGTRLLLELTSRRGNSRDHRAFIYGAGAAGSILLAEVRANARFGRLICGFIDDDRRKRGMLLNGMPVRGCGAELPSLAARYTVDEVLIAIPSATGLQMSRIIGDCQAAGLVFRTMPALCEMQEGRGVSSQIRDVAVEDILGRTTVVLNHEQIAERLRGRVVLVSGAAGSIGFELCRQIARFRPERLVAFDIAESALFDLEQEMRRSFPGLNFSAEIGSVQNVQRLREVFARHRPAGVYHAAAYKHVPLMEHHVFEAIENNIVGTFNIASVAADYGVDDFIMISSDKAVRPTNIMGATKRVAEIIIRSLQNGGPRYVAVRFGNVLGSNGSVVPIFKRQIASGGPVTVTHPEMRRYFMTIPEAAQLVLQASTMGKGGEIFILDMGTPMKIVDLAVRLIRLSGLKPEDDIKIQFTGIRPGEKLYEELNVDSEEALETHHEKIKIFSGGRLEAGDALSQLAILRAACERRDLAGVVLALKKLVPDYNPGCELLENMMAPDLTRLAAAVTEAPGIPGAGVARHATGVFA